MPLGIYNAGALRQPKWGHLRDLHKAIKLCEAALVATDPKTTSLGHNIEVMYIIPKHLTIIELT